MACIGPHTRESHSSYPTHWFSATHCHRPPTGFAVLQILVQQAGEVISVFTLLPRAYHGEHQFMASISDLCENQVCKICWFPSSFFITALCCHTWTLTAFPSSMSYSAMRSPPILTIGSSHHPLLTIHHLSLTPLVNTFMSLTAKSQGCIGCRHVR